MQYVYTNQVRLNDLIDNYVIVIAWYTSSTDGKIFIHVTSHLVFFFEKVDGSQFNKKNF